MSDGVLKDEYNSHTSYNIHSMSIITYLKTLSQSFLDAANNGLAGILRHWKILLFGQLLSFCLAASGATSSELFLRCSLNAPTAQYSIMYFMLSFHVIPIFFKDVRWKGFIPEMKENEEDVNRKANEWNLEALPRGNETTINRPTPDDGSNSLHSTQRNRIPFLNIQLKGPLRLYFLMAVMDVEANFFTILAFRYTSLTSITLLDALAIPGAMIASKFLLRCKYRRAHLLGAGICIAGTILNVFSDYRQEEEEIEVS